MEKLIFYGGNRFKGTTSETMKKKLYKNYHGKYTFQELELDHIIPYCISEDNSIKNLQLIPPNKHYPKSILDKNYY